MSKNSVHHRLATLYSWRQFMKHHATPVDQAKQQQNKQRDLNTTTSNKNAA